MISRKVTAIFWSGIVLFIILILTAISRFVLPDLPEGFVNFSIQLQTTFYWSIPLVILIFLSPYILEQSRRADIHFRFRPRDDDSVLLVLVNKGDTPFSFNRMQFFTKQSWLFRAFMRKPKFLTPEHGRIGVEFQKPNMEHGFGNYIYPNWDAGLSIERGTPVVLLLRKDFCQGELKSLRAKTKKKPIHLRLYFEDSPMKVDSKEKLPDKFVESCTT
jgi:hypothetical protein